MEKGLLGIVALIALALVGCEGGGANCPWQRPSCCDNNLFGCGPFDLPQGCSCGDYFSRSFRGSPIQSKASPNRQTLTTTEGTWRVSLTKSGEGCSYLKKQTTATVLIRERNQQVTMKLLGFANLRGSRSGRNVRTRGSMRVPFSRCSADVTSAIALSSATAGTVTGTVNVSCASQKLSCSSSYSGNIRKM